MDKALSLLAYATAPLQSDHIRAADRLLAARIRSGADAALATRFEVGVPQGPGHPPFTTVWIASGQGTTAADYLKVGGIKSSPCFGDRGPRRTRAGTSSR